MLIEERFLFEFGDDRSPKDDCENLDSFAAPRIHHVIFLTVITATISWFIIYNVQREQFRQCTFSCRSPTRGNLYLQYLFFSLSYFLFFTWLHFSGALVNCFE